MQLATCPHDLRVGVPELKYMQEAELSGVKCSSLLRKDLWINTPTSCKCLNPGETLCMQAGGCQETAEVDRLYRTNNMT